MITLVAPVRITAVQLIRSPIRAAGKPPIRTWPRGGAGPGSTTLPGPAAPCGGGGTGEAQAQTVPTTAAGRPPIRTLPTPRIGAPAGTGGPAAAPGGPTVPVGGPWPIWSPIRAAGGIAHLLF